MTRSRNALRRIDSVERFFSPRRRFLLAPAVALQPGGSGAQPRRHDSCAGSTIISAAYVSTNHNTSMSSNSSIYSNSNHIINTNNELSAAHVVVCVSFELQPAGPGLSHEDVIQTNNDSTDD